MPYRRTFSRRPVGLRRPRRKMIWARSILVPSGSAVPTSVAAGAGAGIDLLADAQTQMGADFVGSTVLRIRGRIHVYLTTQSAAASGGFVTAIRVNDVTDTNFTPLTTGRYEDWMYYDSGHLRITGTANAIAPSVAE